MLRHAWSLFIVGPLWGQVPTYTDHANLLLVREAERERPITTAAAWAKRRQHILAHMQSVMGPFPDAKKACDLEPKLLKEEDQGTYIRYSFTLQPEPGDRLPFYVLVPKKTVGKRPAVLCLHPTSKEFGKGVPVGLGGKDDRHYAMHLVERGYITMAPDYPNMGEYRFDREANGYISTTMKGIWNHRRCVDYLLTRKDVDGERIGVLGHSLGGHNAIFLGVFDERVKCIVSNCGFCSFPRYMKGDLTGWSHAGYMPLIKSQYDAKPDKMPWDFTEAVAALAPRAFLASAPTRDHNFAVEGVRDCIRAAEPVYRLLKAEKNLAANYPDADHNFPADVRKVAYEWLDRHLQK